MGNSVKQVLGLSDMSRADVEAKECVGMKGGEMGY